jgi:hypothetical protein
MRTPFFCMASGLPTPNVVCHLLGAARRPYRAMAVSAPGLPRSVRAALHHMPALPGAGASHGAVHIAAGSDLWPQRDARRALCLAPVHGASRARAPGLLQQAVWRCGLVPDMRAYSYIQLAGLGDCGGVPALVHIIHFSCMSSPGASFLNAAILQVQNAAREHSQQLAMLWSGGERAHLCISTKTAFEGRLPTHV